MNRNRQSYVWNKIATCQYINQVLKLEEKDISLHVEGVYLSKPDSALPAIGGHCTSAAVLIGCHAQRNGPIESNGEI